MSAGFAIAAGALGAALGQRPADVVVKRKSYGEVLRYLDMQVGGSRTGSRSAQAEGWPRVLVVSTAWMYSYSGVPDSCTLEAK